MKTNIGKFLLCAVLLVLTAITGGALKAGVGKMLEAQQEPVRQMKGDSIQTFYRSDISAQDVSTIIRRIQPQANSIKADEGDKGIEAPLTVRQMIENLRLSGIGAEKTEAICLIAEMLFADGKEVEFIAGVCGNVLCEGRNGMFERDWGGSTQNYMPSRLSGDPYKYDAKYGNKHIYDGFSLSEVYKMAKELYYSYNWDTGKYKFGLGCVQWTHKRTITLIEYYMEEADGSDTITQEQCVAAEMKLIDYELNNTETAAYEHWIAGDHKSQYKNEAARAGYCVAKYYERCHSDYYSMRAQRAVEVYEAMTARYEVSLHQSVAADGEQSSD